MGLFNHGPRIPETDHPADIGPGALLAANPHLGSRDMRDLLMEFGANGVKATELTQARQEDEQAANARFDASGGTRC